MVKFQAGGGMNPYNPMAECNQGKISVKSKEREASRPASLRPRGARPLCSNLSSPFPDLTFLT